MPSFKSKISFLIFCFALVSEVGAFWPFNFIFKSSLKKETDRIHAIVADSLQINFELLQIESEGRVEKPLISISGQVPVAPASVLKVFTAGVALVSLGEDYRFKTRLIYDPLDMETDSSGIVFLNGELRLVAGGDPTLVSRDLRQLAIKLWQLGIDSLAGDLVIDRSRFSTDRFGPGWMWDDGSRSWASRVSACTINQNCLSIFQSAPCDPATSSLLRIKELPFSPENSGAFIFRNWRMFEDEFVLRYRANQLPDNYVSRWTHPISPYVNVEWPDSLFRSALYGTFSEILTGVEEPVFEKHIANPVSELTELVLHSPPLAQILDSCVTESWNLGAECVFQELSANDSLGQGSWRKSAVFMHDFLEDELQLNTNFRIVDGSGMSRYNSISMSQVCHFLSAIELESSGKLREILAIAGEEGTLKSGFENLPDGIVIHAKSGTLSGRILLSGYIEKSGEPLVTFSLSLAGSNQSMTAMRLAQDKIVLGLARFVNGRY
jgi:serine-type D-Ala-D-Ala carboxypeptidase/endopeptidase (penicillin-binding protein 4)